MNEQPQAPGATESFGQPMIRRERPVPLRQMGIGEVIDGAFRLYRAEWKAFLGIAAFVVIPTTFLQLWVTELVLANADIGPTSAAIGQILGLTLVFIAVQFLLVQPFLVAAVARAAADTYLGEPVSIGATYRFALERLLPILWVTILSSLAVFGGFILLVIPGIIAVVRLTFAPAVLVVEGQGGPAALRRSWHLSSGSFWRVLGALVISGLIASVIATVLSIPAELVVQALGPQAWPISALATSLVTVLTTPFTILVIVLLYFDLRIRKEGFDLEVMARELAPGQ